MLRFMKFSMTKILVSIIISIVSFNVCSSTATYRLTVTNNWTPTTHPIGYPQDAHFSWVGGGTHSGSETFWQLGGISSLGMEQMAETGVTTMLLDEITAAGGSTLNWRHWFCPDNTMHFNCRDTIVEFTADSSQHFLTLVSMVAPSPDWFVGVSGLNLMDASGDWKTSISIPLAMYDAGTEEGVNPTLTNPETTPFEPIVRIRYDVTTGHYLPAQQAHHIGNFLFELLSVEEDPETKTVPFPFFSFLILGLSIIVISFFRYKTYR